LGAEVAVRTRGVRGWPWVKQLFIIRLQIAWTQVAMAFGLRIFVGKLDMSRLKEGDVASSDYRKFDNTLKMVVAVDKNDRESIQTLLETARAEGKIFYGLHVTDRAMITCLLHTGAGHEVHFVDAADGGYAYAARQLKDQIRGS
jgi:hypothetical protein